MTETQPEDKAGFVKGLGLTGATTLVMGSMIGSGIFIVSADVSRQVKSPGLLIVCWLLGALLTIVAALSYGELAAMLPHAGGQYVYLREAFGRLWGGLLGWSASLVALSVTFFFARAGGGKPLAEVKNARVRRVLSRLDSHPFLTIFTLRTFFTLSAWLNYSLALSGVRYRDYLVASATGLVVPIVVFTFFFDAILRLYSFS